MIDGAKGESNREETLRNENVQPSSESSVEGPDPHRRRIVSGVLAGAAATMALSFVTTRSAEAQSCPVDVVDLGYSLDADDGQDCFDCADKIPADCLDPNDAWDPADVVKKAYDPGDSDADADGGDGGDGVGDFGGDDRGGDDEIAD